MFACVHFFPEIILQREWMQQFPSNLVRRAGARPFFCCHAVIIRASRLHKHLGRVKMIIILISGWLLLQIEHVKPLVTLSQFNYPCIFSSVTTKQQRLLRIFNPSEKVQILRNRNPSWKMFAITIRPAGIFCSELDEKVAYATKAREKRSE